MNPDAILTRSIACALFLLALSAPSRGGDARNEDVAELKRAIMELQAQNRSLTDRLNHLETGQRAQEPGAPRLPSPQASNATPSAQAPADTEELARRVKELEISKMAQDDATRAIIRDSVSKLGSKINQAVALGGAIEMIAGRTQDFAGNKTSALRLNTAELDLEIQANPWTTASLVVAYVDGGDVLFPNTRGFDSGVDRFTVDTASVTIGDVQRFPLYLKAGRMALGYGSSTGVHRADVLSIEGPLTTDAFETRREAIGIGFGWPTPLLTRAAPPVIVPPVHPQALVPLVGALGRQLGYVPLPQHPTRPLPVSFPPEPPPFYGSLLFYEGHNIGTPRDFAHNINGRLGYRANGHCGKPYSELRDSIGCPWSLDVSLDYISSVFDSRFLATEYRPFMNQFEAVDGLASTVKLSFGPVQLVGEWSGAMRRAEFQDDAGSTVSIRPAAWQLAVGYQFDWNPWVEAVGAQGSYLALGYSESRDLTGATQLLGTTPTRVGYLPRSRWTLTAGEWVQEGLKVQLEYSRTTDYDISQGGTGATANGLQMTLTYSW